MYPSSKPNFIFYTCDRCRFVTQQRSDFFSHMIGYHCLISYCCAFCSYFSGDRQAVEEHFLQKHCRTISPNDSQHLSTATFNGKLPVVVGGQSSSFSPINSPSIVKASPTAPEKQQPTGLVCSECFVSSFSSLNEWRYHMMDLHRWVPCLLCDDVLPSYRQLEFHVQVKHRSNNNVQPASMSVPALEPNALPLLSLSMLRNLLAASPPPRAEPARTPSRPCYPQPSHANQYHPYASPLPTPSLTPSPQSEFYGHTTASLPPRLSPQQSRPSAVNQKQQKHSTPSSSMASDTVFLTPTMMPTIANMAAAALAKMSCEPPSTPPIKLPPFPEFVNKNNIPSFGPSIPLATSAVRPLQVPITTPSTSSLGTASTSSSANNLSQGPTFETRKLTIGSSSPPTQTQPTTSKSCSNLVPSSPTAVQEMALQCIAELIERGTNRHNNNQQATPPKQPFLCKLCNRKLSSAFSLLCHYRSHAGIKPYSCSLCHARFTQQNSLSYHLLIHKNLKPFTCTICARSYRNKQLYKKHMRLHNSGSVGGGKGGEIASTSVDGQVVTISSDNSNLTMSCDDCIEVEDEDEDDLEHQGD